MGEMVTLNHQMEEIVMLMMTMTMNLRKERLSKRRE